MPSRLPPIDPASVAPDRRSEPAVRWICRVPSIAASRLRNNLGKQRCGPVSLPTCRLRWALPSRKSAPIQRRWRREKRTSRQGSDRAGIVVRKTMSPLSFRSQNPIPWDSRRTPIRRARGATCGSSTLNRTEDKSDLRTRSGHRQGAEHTVIGRRPKQRPLAACGCLSFGTHAGLHRRGWHCNPCSHGVSSVRVVCRRTAVQANGR
jgi:hypothetical protein